MFQSRKQSQAMGAIRIIQKKTMVTQLRKKKKKIVQASSESSFGFLLGEGWGGFSEEAGRGEGSGLAVMLGSPLTPLTSGVLLLLRLLLRFLLRSLLALPSRLLLRSRLLRFKLLLRSLLRDRLLLSRRLLRSPSLLRDLLLLSRRLLRLLW